jgi:hypothetical protein
MTTRQPLVAMGNLNRVYARDIDAFLKQIDRSNHVRRSDTRAENRPARH